MRRVIVVGGGAAGLMAAVSAATFGANVTVFEKMPSVGRKILITGKGRCNVTNNCDLETFIKNMPGNGIFLYSALSKFNNKDIVDFLERFGVNTKVERGGRIFPVSDDARDVVKAFVKALGDLKVNILTMKKVTDVVAVGGKVKHVLAEGKSYEADAVIIATGGLSYPGTGSTGDGYAMARKLGHNIVQLKPSLVPLEVEEDWAHKLQGLSLRNVCAKVVYDNKVVAEEFGEMLFTHYGVSGPIILTLSRKVSHLLDQKPNDLLLQINLKPALTEQKLDQRIQRDFAKYARKRIKNGLSDLLPERLIEPIIDLAFIDPEKPVHQVTKVERYRLIEQLTRLSLTIRGMRPIEEAIVTAGGVSTKEIHPATMESKIVKGLFFAGEVIDVDGYTGGYNLQAAFSTGYLAGMSAAAEMEQLV